MALVSYGEPQLTADQVARYLGVSKSTFYNWRTRGEGPPAHKFGGRSGPLRYQRGDVEKWLAENRDVRS